VREPTIAAGYARALMALAVSKGASERALAERSGIEPATLEDQDARVPLARYLALMGAGKELCNDPALALHFGEAYEISELSIVGLIGNAATTFAESLAQLNRYHRLVADIDTGADDGLALARSGGELWLIDRRASVSAHPELVESGFARMVCASRRYVRDRPLVMAVHVMHAAPAYADEYARILQVPVTFESDKNALQLRDDDWLTLKAPLPSKYIFGVLSERADALLASLAHDTTMRGRVERELMPILHTGAASLTLVAERMGLSAQTLSRRLRAEGTTFGKLRDALRHRLAIEYLRGKRVSVKEVAYLVGFSERSAFSRAFRRWTGASPGPSSSMDVRRE